MKKNDKKLLTNVLERMDMQKHNHEINPIDFPAPSFEMFVDFLKEEVEKGGKK